MNNNQNVLVKRGFDQSRDQLRLVWLRNITVPWKSATFFVIAIFVKYMPFLTDFQVNFITKCQVENISMLKMKIIEIYQHRPEKAEGRKSLKDFSILKDILPEYIRLPCMCCKFESHHVNHFAVTLQWVQSCPIISPCQKYRAVIINPVKVLFCDQKILPHFEDSCVP